MFSGTNITTADLRGWDLSKVTDMSYMFENCYKLTTVMMDSELSPNLTVIYSMFKNITTEGTFYYNPAYDYSKIIDQLPATWTAVPLTE
jgi:surface protein